MIALIIQGVSKFVMIAFLALGVLFVVFHSVTIPMMTGSSSGEMMMENMTNMMNSDKMQKYDESQWWRHVILKNDEKLAVWSVDNIINDEKRSATKTEHVSWLYDWCPLYYQHDDNIKSQVLQHILSHNAVIEQMRDTDPTTQQNIQDHLLEHHELMQTLIG